MNHLQGDRPQGELSHFFGLGIGFFLLIGSYWPLKMLKSSVFLATVGSEYIPTARTLSLFMLFPTMAIYSVLVDTVKRRNLFTYACTFYAITGSLLALMLAHPTIGLANTTPGPDRIIGWLFYLFVDTYISPLNTLYWTLINDTTSEEAAKRNYGLLIFFTQSGALLFLLLGRYLAQDTTSYHQYAPGLAAFSLLITLLLGYFVKHLIEHPTEKPGAAPKNKFMSPRSLVSMFSEGISVIAQRPYVTGIFGIIACQHITSEIFSYQLHAQVAQNILDSGYRNLYFFNYGVTMQIIACIFALIGTSRLHRKIGIKASLMAYPIILGLGVISYYYSGTLSSITLVVIITKVLSYALNQPTKEVLYIPTDDIVKYKAKGWIDVFGERFAKFLGARASALLSTQLGAVSLFLLGVASTWTFIAQQLGTAFNKLHRKASQKEATP
jgi:AAA family ATP:ADP antiporter